MLDYKINKYLYKLKYYFAKGGYNNYIIQILNE